MIQMKKKLSEYDDPWKRFKILLLKQIEYFKKFKNFPDLLDDIQYHMQEENFECGTDIISCQEQTQSILFVVHGKIQLSVEGDSEQEPEVLEDLVQGDIIGQYSALFDEPLNFQAKALSKVRILTLN